jgi:hypothetical protein
MNNTPETDACWDSASCNLLHHAQNMERERDEARKQIKELIYIAERAIALAEIDFENDKFGVVSELRNGMERLKEGAK